MATDFSSLDKLMEFGLGIGIATQMMNTMNSVIARTAYPGTSLNPGVEPTPAYTAAGCLPEKTFYIVSGEHVAGPLNEAELSILVSKGTVNARTFCWAPGMAGWTFAEEIPEINKLILLNS